MDRKQGERGGGEERERTVKKKKKKLSHIALMSSGKKWDTVATHTQTHAAVQCT